MKKFSKIPVVVAVMALTMLTWLTANAYKDAGCKSGTTKICFKVTANGETSYNCNSTTGNIKDCQ